MSTGDLFDEQWASGRERMGVDAVILHGFALPYVQVLLPAIADIEAHSPLRHMVTPGGFTMSVALTNCGEWGWTSDRHGYRYSRLDPDSGQPWQAMPDAFAQLAHEAALAAGIRDFVPDACLINRYRPGSRLSLHQDRNERDLNAPIASVSLGMKATFLFGGHQRTDPTTAFALYHGDVAVWGGQDRLRYHGIAPLKGPPHPLLGTQRINFTFRKAK